MIFVKRLNISVQYNTKARQEHVDAENYYNSMKYYCSDKKKGFPHVRYKDDEVSKLLDKMFFGKCAYCESKIDHVSPVDIEHFRPKGQVNDGDVLIKPAYYWLGAEWSNLLASCPHCNRSEKHENQYGNEKLGGKWDQFPLKEGAVRARYSTDNDEINRLLINPCIEDPEDYFYFSKNGSIHPKRGISPAMREMAEESAKVYALIRIKLVGQRADHYLTIQKRIKDVKNRLRDYLNEKTIERKEELKEALDELKSYENVEKKAYIAVTRQLIQTKKEEIQNALRGLID